MDSFQQDLKKASPTSSTSNLSTEFNTFRNFILTALNTLQQQVLFLGRAVDSQEMHRRRKMLLFHGVTEDQAQRDQNKISKLVTEQLEVSDFSTDSIKKCYRLGRPSGKKPRPIVVKFNNSELRDKVWFRKTKLKGTGVTQSEFLTKSRHDVFLQARERFGVNKCWTKNGNIYILSPDGSRHRAETSLDVLGLSQDLPKATSASLQVKQANNKTASSLAGKLEMQRSKRITKK